MPEDVKTDVWPAMRFDLDWHLVYTQLNALYLEIVQVYIDDIVRCFIVHYVRKFLRSYTFSHRIFIIYCKYWFKFKLHIFICVLLILIVLEVLKQRDWWLNIRIYVEIEMKIMHNHAYVSNIFEVIKFRWNNYISFEINHFYFNL